MHSDSCIVFSKSNKILKWTQNCLYKTALFSFNFTCQAYSQNGLKIKVLKIACKVDYSHYKAWKYWNLCIT